MKKTIRFLVMLIKAIMIAIAAMTLLGIFCDLTRGQEKIWYTNDAEADFLTNEYDELDWSREYFTVAFLYLYSEYEKECYADSTQEALFYNFNGSIFSSEYHGDAIGNMITDSLKCIHREPTFQGFMEFLKREE